MTIAVDNPEALGQQLRAARAARSLSLREAAARAGIGRSTLLDLEQGRVASPNPTALAALARVLAVPLADLYATAGYTPSADLPAFTPYLRSKYADLPPEGRDELARSFDRITRKYGVDPNGPAPGQDE